VKKHTYIVFSEEGNRVYVNPKQVPKDAVKVDTKLLPKGVSPSFLKYDAQTKQIQVMNRHERKLALIKRPADKLKEKRKYKYLRYFVLSLLIAGSIAIVWQQYN